MDTALYSVWDAVVSHKLPVDQAIWQQVVGKTQRTHRRCMIYASIELQQLARNSHHPHLNATTRTSFALQFLYEFALSFELLSLKGVPCIVFTFGLTNLCHRKAWRA